MLTNTKINIALIVLIAFVVIVGGFALVNLGSTPQETFREEGIRKEASGEERQAYFEAMKKEIIVQIEEKQSQFEKINDQIVFAQKACGSVDLARVTVSEVKDIGRENFTQTIAGYYTCEAVTNKNIDQCNFLKSVDSRLFERCILNAANIRIAAEKCSVESINQCIKSGLLTRADCNNICAMYSQNDASVCSIAKDADLNKVCLAFTQKNIDLCNGIADGSQKESCRNEYHFYTAIQNNNAGALNDMVYSFKKAIGDVMFDGSVSCKSEFTKFINEYDCMHGLVDDYDIVQKTADNLRNEIADLNKKLAEIQ
ncbi:hypothetical protein A2Z10_00255 [Candidatus Azambacteria bacterium RBG_16_47_10]|uniref:Uncharacterized protein n=1 Tax=Candidatus Azambacteria bacterium RBG_16_47_10 TaxID=1797292 RepID=A0A1F5B160_9BACT|nr:MAG: hypothetical protein A2Z10_00255 [Candidatus Azambacteria bacterium RBG_16_47_10]